MSCRSASRMTAEQGIASSRADFCSCSLFRILSIRFCAVISSTMKKSADIAPSGSLTGFIDTFQISVSSSNVVRSPLCRTLSASTRRYSQRTGTLSSSTISSLICRPINCSGVLPNLEQKRVLVLRTSPSGRIRNAGSGSDSSSWHTDTSSERRVFTGLLMAID